MERTQCFRCTIGVHEMLQMHRPVAHYSRYEHGYQKQHNSCACEYARAWKHTTQVPTVRAVPPEYTAEFSPHGHILRIVYPPVQYYAIPYERAPNRSTDACHAFKKIPELARGFTLQSCTPAALSDNTSGCYRARCNKSCKHDNHRHLNWHNLLCQAMLRKKIGFVNLTAAQETVCA